VIALRLLGLKDWPRNPAERAAYVDSVFGAIAPKYDVASKLLSLWQDRRWKARALGALPPDNSVGSLLDLATGTGAFPILLRRAGFAGKIVGLDRSRAMLLLAGEKCGRGPGVELVQGDLGELPFADASFDAITMGYGLRYAGDLRPALAGIHRLLRPNGVFVCLDFGTPENRWHRRACLAYLLLFGTLWGLILHGRRDTYWHLVESLRAYPGQGALRRLMAEVGFTDVELQEQLGGISVIACGRRR
jgi:demethylmenaquinone methyltransferase/2-methoxy-6-polyprenyl-1,4-benzoquinol methylase